MINVNYTQQVINAQSALLFAFTFFIGACFGSFANVLIYRLPRRLQFVTGVSSCPMCNKRIMPRDLIPIWSYLVLGGKCRYCKSPIPKQYIIVEAITGALAVLSACTYVFTPIAFVYFFILTTLLVISVIDAVYMLIPDELLAVLALLSIIYSFSNGAVEVSVVSRIAGFFALSLPMLLLTLLIKDAFGGGDIKLIAVCGFLLGIRFIFLAGFIAVLTASCKGIYIKYITRNRDITHIAFGQYICFGVFITFQLVSLHLSYAPI